MKPEHRERLASLAGRNFGAVSCAANDLRRTMMKQTEDKREDRIDPLTLTLASTWLYCVWGICFLFCAAVWYLVWGFVA